MADEPLELWIYDNAGWENVFYASLYMAHQEKKNNTKGDENESNKDGFPNPSIIGTHLWASIIDHLHVFGTLYIYGLLEFHHCVLLAYLGKR